MPWTIPDKGEGDNDLQSILFQEYLEVLVEGINGQTCVVSGCAVTGGADMTPEVAKGAVLSNGTLFAVPAGNVTIGTADTTNPRIDLVVVTVAGALAVRAGTAAATPKPPARSTNDVVLAAVYVPANDTSIETSKITDLRVVRSTGVVLKKTVTQVQFSNTAAQQTYFSLTLPNGLFLAGKQLRIRCGGSYLSNSGTPTWSLAIVFGGTTMFQDATATTTADADRGTWMLDFTLVAKANSDHRVHGRCHFQTPGAKTAPTVGNSGDLAVTTHVGAPFLGSGSGIDTDTADRTLDVRWTMSVANAAVDTALEFAVAELL
jgi:hypothetical protein